MKLAEDILQQFEKLELSDANEAETRLKLIDRIIFEFLGWSHDDVEVEQRASEDGQTQFSDYVIKTAGSAFVIEAKRIGRTFSEETTKRRVRLGGQIIKTPTGEFIKQARDYCRALGIQFAIVTNGAQWIIFPAIRTDQITFTNSSAIIFPNLESVLRDDSDEFRELLSREGVIQGSLENALLGRTGDQIAERRLNNYYFNRFNKVRPNPLFPLIEDAILTAFTDSIIDDDPELLQKCYVRSPDRTKFDRRINMHIERVTPDFRRELKRPMRRKNRNALNDVIDAAKTRIRPVAILILGTVGAGKTTFLHYTRKVSAAEYFDVDTAEPHPHWMHIDFRGFSESQNAVEYIYSNVIDYFSKDKYFSDYSQSIRPAYSDEIRSLTSGPLKLLSSDEAQVNKEIVKYLMADYEKINPYVDKLLVYATTKAPVFIVVDNIDQLENDELQSKLFIDSMALAHKWGVNLVLGLRDATFARHRSSPTFNAFDTDPIYIDPPNIHSVLSKRFFLTKQLLSGRSASFDAENGARVEIEDLANVVDLIQSSVLGTKVGEIIDVLATSDVRLALRMCREFLETGYTAFGKAIQRYQAGKDYVLPRHEAFRAILLGKQSVYSEKMSVIGNPFDSRLAQNKSQLLRIYIMSALVQYNTTGSGQFVEGDAIRQSLEEIGFSADKTLEILSDLCRLRFLFTAGQTAVEFSSLFYPSRLAGYVVRELLADFTFLENVQMDTFIGDTAIWEQLKSLSDKVEAERDVVERIRLRRDRVRTFFNYMEALYSPLRDESVRRGLSAEWCSEPFGDIRRKLLVNTKRPVESAKRLYGKRH
ncbi:MAG: hypothetical protein PF501_02560 [Salinisphaera sp.]|jgi:hypothetical protein|nr:hypothetical protein [Salinisphaera sp.]